MVTRRTGQVDPCDPSEQSQSLTYVTMLWAIATLVSDNGTNIALRGKTNSISDTRGWRGHPWLRS